MHNKFLESYFTLNTWLLYSCAAIPEKKQLKTELRTVLFNRVWPVVFILIWIPILIMVSLKIIQLVVKKQWEDLFDMMHMYVLGCNALYIVYAAQRTPKFYKSTSDKIQKYFVSCGDFGWKDIKIMWVLWLIISLSFVFYISGSIYYKEVLVPAWIPFIDNDLPYSSSVFFGLWVYEGIAGIYFLIAYGFISPFTVVSNKLIIKEINYMIKKLNELKFEDNSSKMINNKKLFDFMKYSTYENTDSLKNKNNGKNKQDMTGSNNVLLRTLCSSELDTKEFIRNFVKHHLNIKSVIGDMARIHYYMFFTQAFFTIFLSCFLAFNMYYTDRLNKVIIKSSPILFLSYYLLYIYCWNGQRLTDVGEDLFRALYCCEWYNFPHSFKKSLLLIMQHCNRPLKLSGGGIFSASFETFLHGLQQSISYILLLKQIAPENKFK